MADYYESTVPIVTFNTNLAANKVSLKNLRQCGAWNEKMLDNKDKRPSDVPEVSDKMSA